MRGNGARRVLLVSLTVLFAVLVVFYARRSVNTEMEIESRYPRQNPSLSLELGKDGIIRIEGEGKLYGTDMNALLSEHRIRSKAVLNVIVGDGITEIGYDALASKKYLVTLKLGKNVRRITAGAVKSCAELQYIYLPAGLERVGGDFLFGCDNCRVVTDGTLADLPSMANVTEDTTVLERVDSYQALADACGDGSVLPMALKQWWP